MDNLIDQAKARRAELVRIQNALPADRLTERSDLQLAIDTADRLLTSDQLTDATAADLSRWLEENKYLGA